MGWDPRKTFAGDNKAPGMNTNIDIVNPVKQAVGDFTSDVKNVFSPEANYDGARDSVSDMSEVGNKKGDVYETGVRGVKAADDKYVDSQTRSNADLTRETRTAGNQFKASSQHVTDDFVEEQEGLRNKLEEINSSTNAVYDTSVMPALKNLQEKANQDMNREFSLADLMDPNNAVAQGQRDLYNESYEDLAQQTRATGLSTAGIIGSMGAQQTGQQLAQAGVPMNAGMMQALAAQNQSQASQAYGRTLDRMADLREQGVSGGLLAGERAANRAYDASEQQYQNALNRGQSLAGQMENAALNRGNFGTGIVDRMGGISGNIANARQGQADRIHGIDTNQAGLEHSLETGMNQFVRDSDANFASGMTQADMMPLDVQMNEINQLAGIDMAEQTGKISQQNALASLLATLGGAGIGAFAGGAPGAAAGANVGGTLAQNMNPTQYSGGYQGPAMVPSTYQPYQGNYVPPGAHQSLTGRSPYGTVAT